MRLIDFDRSTIDLNVHTALFIESQAKLPVIDLRATQQRLYLLTGSGTPLTLDQFRTRAQQVAPTVTLFTPGPTEKRLYGYRLIPHQILLG